MKKRGILVFLLVFLFLVSLGLAAEGCFTYKGSPLYCYELEPEDASDECSTYSGCNFKESFFLGRNCVTFPACEEIYCKSTCDYEYLGNCAGGKVPSGQEYDWCSSGCCKIDSKSCSYKKSKWLCEVEAKNKGITAFEFDPKITQLECTDVCSKKVILPSKVTQINQPYTPPPTAPAKKTTTTTIPSTEKSTTKSTTPTKSSTTSTTKPPTTKASSTTPTTTSTSTQTTATTPTLTTTKPTTLQTTTKSITSNQSVSPVTKKETKSTSQSETTSTLIWFLFVFLFVLIGFYLAYLKNKEKMKSGPTHIKTKPKLRFSMKFEPRTPSWGVFSNKTKHQKHFQKEKQELFSLFGETKEKKRTYIDLLAKLSQVHELKKARWHHSKKERDFFKEVEKTISHLKIKSHHKTNLPQEEAQEIFERLKQISEK